MTYISAEIRRLVAERAGRRCEYCLIHEDDTFLGCEVDHIISKKHGGSNEPENFGMVPYDMYEIFVETIFAFLSVACRVIPTGMEVSNSNKVSMTHKQPFQPSHPGEPSQNLAYACLFCNRHKGTDIGSIYPNTGKLMRFYNPRKDRWGKHFQLNDVIIKPLTGIGEVTVRLFVFNNSERLLE